MGSGERNALFMQNLFFFQTPGPRTRTGSFFVLETPSRVPESQGLDNKKGSPKARGPVLIGMGWVEPERLRARLPPSLLDLESGDPGDPPCPAA